MSRETNGPDKGAEQTEPTASSDDANRTEHERQIELTAEQRRFGAEGYRHLEAAASSSKQGHQERFAAGVAFQKLKESVGHGRFMQAVEQCGSPHRKATLSVSLAERRIFYDGKLASLANLDLAEMGASRLDATLKQLERDGKAVSSDISSKLPELTGLLDRISNPEILHYKPQLDADWLRLLAQRILRLADDVGETAPADEPGASDGDSAERSTEASEADDISAGPSDHDEDGGYPPFDEDDDDDQPPFGGVRTTDTDT
jgi:hypothetical protein